MQSASEPITEESEIFELDEAELLWLVEEVAGKNLRRNPRSVDSE